MKKTNLLIACCLIFLLSSCKTYYIPVDSFRQQFAGMDASSMKEVTTRGPAGDKVHYKTYPIDSIRCVDNNGHPFALKNGPSIEIRFTDSHNKKTIFYFDLLAVTDSTVQGRQSRLISAFQKTIPLAGIKKIEVQDGKKNFRYVD